MHKAALTASRLRVGVLVLKAKRLYHFRFKLKGVGPRELKGKEMKYTFSSVMIIISLFPSEEKTPQKRRRSFDTKVIWILKHLFYQLDVLQQQKNCFSQRFLRISMPMIVSEMYTGYQLSLLEYRANPIPGFSQQLPREQRRQLRH